MYKICMNETIPSPVHVCLFPHRTDYLGMPFQAIEASLSGAKPKGKIQFCDVIHNMSFKNPGQELEPDV